MQETTRQRKYALEKRAKDRGSTGGGGEVAEGSRRAIQTTGNQTTGIGPPGGREVSEESSRGGDRGGDGTREETEIGQRSRERGPSEDSR